MSTLVYAFIVLAAWWCGFVCGCVMCRTLYRADKLPKSFTEGKR